MLKWLLSLCLCALPVSGQIRLTQPNPVSLKIEVRYDRDNARVAYALVELMDSVGSSNVTDKQHTDRDGQIEFRTLTGKHMLRVSGQDIETWEGELEIQLSERSHFEQIRVVRKKTGESASGPVQPVAAIRLKIPGAARKHYDAGLKDLKKQHWSAAEKRFTQAIEGYGDYDSAYNGLGVARMALRDRVGARDAFLKAISLNESYAEALRNLSRIFLQEREYDRAVPLLTRSLNSEPTNSWAMVSLANANLQLGRFSEALAWAARMHSLPPPEDPTGHFIAGVALDAQGMKPEALEQFSIYLKEEPSGANAVKAREYVTRMTASQ